MQYYGLKLREEGGAPDIDCTNTSLEDIKATAIEKLNLTMRAYLCLERANIKTIGELLELSEKQLMQIKTVGRRNFGEIMYKLTTLRFKFER